MARCNVYVFAYRRPALLQRVVDGLLRQTFVDWHGELHNDCPWDPGPEKLWEERNDRRLKLLLHEHNIGVIKSLNLALQETTSEFIAIVEDDVWWEADFLQQMVNALEAHPDVAVAWSNQALWEERPGSGWVNTGECTGPAGREPVLLNWPHHAQILGGLHRGGSLLIRSRIARELMLPETLPAGFRDAVRERAFPFPALYHPKPMVHRATSQKSRINNNPILSRQMRIIMASTFFSHVPLTTASQQSVWAEYRNEDAVIELLLSGWLRKECRHLWGGALNEDWKKLLFFALRHPLQFIRLLRPFRNFPEVVTYLDHVTALRLKELHRREGRV